MEGRLRSTVESLRKMGGPLADSPALERAAKKGAPLKTGEQNSLKFNLSRTNSIDLDKIASGFKSASKQFESFRRWGNSTSNSIRAKMPNIPKISGSSMRWTSKVSFPRVSMGSFSAPRISSGGLSGFGAGLGSSASELITPLIVAILVVVAVMLLLKLRPQLKLAVQSRLANRRKPSSFSSDRDQIRWLFEDVAVERLGDETQSANHRAIAHQFRHATGRGEVADDFADLYERARYTPAEEPLPNGAVPAAQSHSSALRQSPSRT
jgi:hypothetical protein